MTRRAVVISRGDVEIILQTATTAFPRECCGLLEGVVEDDGFRVLAVHVADNLAEEPSHRFLIDPQIHFELLRKLRGTDRRIIGCFHSHPHGRPEPSATDLSQAIEPDFVWLIAGGGPGGFDLRAFIFSGRAFESALLSQDPEQRAAIAENPRDGL